MSSNPPDPRTDEQIAREDAAYNAGYASMRYDSRVWHQALLAAIPLMLAAADAVGTSVVPDQPINSLLLPAYFDTEDDPIEGSGVVPDPTPEPARKAACIVAWPECVDGTYDPRCCRFPKSCSCEVWPAVTTDPETTP